MKKWSKGLICGVLTLALALIIGGFFVAEAAADSITVTSYTTGEVLYSGNSLQDAFDASERGSIVSIGRNYTLTEDVVLRVEVYISGQSYLKFSDYHIQLTGDGAIYVTERFKRSTYITALYSYSEVDWVEESGGYIYYLMTTPPSLEGQEPTITLGGDILGARVDAENARIYLDVSAEGILTDTLSESITMTAAYAEAVQYYFTGHTAGVASNGMVMEAAATNHDYGGTVSKTYSVVILGDVNGNGVIDAADASLIVSYAAGNIELSPEARLAADANQDGYVTPFDATLLSEKFVRPEQYVSPLE